MTLSDLNALDPASATEALLRCCGSSIWARQMTEARPFASVNSLTAAADAIWQSLDASDWLEAFAAHPVIGSGGSGGSGTAEWSREEQAGAAGAPAGVRERMAAANQAYAERFGYIFIICAAGQSADGMLRECERRLSSDPEAELLVAAEEQRKITCLRLTKLLAS
jgi:OHCU decarboxylase